LRGSHRARHGRWLMSHIRPIRQHSHLRAAGTPVVACLLAAFFLLSAGPNTARAATPTPAVTATAFPLAAPSGVAIDLNRGVITWHDNSDGETGFRVVYTAAAVTTTYTAAASSTSFALPAGAPRPCGGRFAASVVAVGRSGESAPGEYQISVECPAALATAVPTQVATSPRLPNTGSGASGRANPPVSWSALALVACMLLSGAALVRGLRPHG
jgi:hypothetical protein